MTVTHIGLGIGGIFCPILNIVDAGLYFLEGDFYHGTESLVFAFVGGKGAQYLAKAGKQFGVGAKVTEGISKACTIGAPVLAAHDTGSSIAFMIDKYGVNGEEISAYTALEAANVVMSGMQTGAYTRNLFGGSYVSNAGGNYENAVAGSDSGNQLKMDLQFFASGENGKYQKASLWERIVKRKADVNELHPNSLDEFSNPKVGPCESAVSKYIKEINQNGKLTNPIEVQKLVNGGYEIVNGHHRWLAAIRTGLKKVSIRIKNYSN